MNTIKNTYKNYKKPPIVEALIDIQVQLGDNSHANLLEKLYEKIKADYPKKESILLKTAQIDVQKEQTSFINTEAGLKLSSLDKKYIAQIKNTGITFSIVNAYHGWNDLYEKAKKLWSEFYTVMKPVKITRVAVRYINRIDIPALKFDLEEYFNVCPKAFDIALSGFFLQIQIPQAEGGLAIVHQTATVPAQAGFTSILLDLDIFDFQDFQPESDEFWKRIDILRDQKDKLFENCITDKTRELFT